MKAFIYPQTCLATCISYSDSTYPFDTLSSEQGITSVMASFPADFKSHRLTNKAFWTFLNL